ncbi:MAG: hypothetical protein V1717_03265 [Candidatus Micrarchaeota archaeon]
MQSDSNSHSHAFSKSVLEVSQAEEQAKRIISRAEEERISVMARGKKRAAEILGNASVEGEKKREQLIEEERRLVQVEAERILAEAKANSAEFKKKPVKQLASELALEILPK